MLDTLIFVALTALLGFGGWKLFQYRAQLRELRVAVTQGSDSPVWENVDPTTSNRIDQVLYAVARPISRSPQLQDLTGSPYFTNLQRLLLLSGGKYYNSLEIFLSVQAAAILVGIGVGATLVAPGILHPIIGLPLALVLAVYPYLQVKQAADKREERITVELPKFADLMLMPIAGGTSVLQALDFTSRRTPGLVSTEVEQMLRNITTRSMSQREAFMTAGHRLGTTEAIQFFATLAQSADSGAGLFESLQAQAESLRKKHYQSTREKMKKLPTKVMLAFFIHLLPLLLVVLLVPALMSFVLILG